MANELKYGDQIHLQNGYGGWQGGYLDTNSGNPAQGSKYGVSTTNTPARAKGTGTWEILSASGKAAGQPVTSGDLIYLRNLYGGDGGYLDTNSGPTTTQANDGAKYDVSTSPARDRAPGTGRWRIFAQTSAPADQNVRFGDTVLLWNTWDDNGGFLETNGGSSDTGSKYDVCTNAYFNRSSNVADWKIHQAQG
ncbi:hypothetical protein [Streptomyces sp. NBC_00847]|uniref:hypothetical protein n=1 Tax=Streptomyces sp. NBC_00847 TaxID=2975850 RepID=UPI002251A41F|nr:hypothetical protein [Streptomyces sp. NBC_00847]MCX4884111.1 hypothetical protein [Streptomyces sp. NBC_00847]